MPEIPISMDIDGPNMSRDFEVDTDMDLIVHDRSNQLLAEFSNDMPKEELQKLQADLKRMVWGPLHTRYLFFIMSLLQFVCGMQFSLGPYIMNEPPRFPVCDNQLPPTLRRLAGQIIAQDDIQQHQLDSIHLDESERERFEKINSTNNLCLPDVPLKDYDCTSTYRYYFQGTSVVETFRIQSTICEDNPLNNTRYPKSALLVGFGIGAWINGMWMDRFGRRKTVSWSTFMFFVSGLASSATGDVNSFVLWRALTGYAMSGMSIGSLVSICELTNRRNRRKIFAMYVFAFFCGVAVTGIIATAIMQWNSLIIIATLPVLFVPTLCARFNIESPRYYLARCENETALAIYRDVAAYNGPGLEDKMMNIDARNLRDFVEALFDDIDEQIDDDVETDPRQMSEIDLDGSPNSQNFLFDDDKSGIIDANAGREKWCSTLTSWPMHLWLWNAVLLYSVCQVQYYGITMDMNSYNQAYDVFKDTTGMDFDGYIFDDTKSAPEPSLADLDVVRRLQDTYVNPHNILSGVPPSQNLRGEHSGFLPMKQQPEAEQSLLEVQEAPQNDQSLVDVQEPSQNDQHDGPMNDLLNDDQLEPAGISVNGDQHREEDFLDEEGDEDTWNGTASQSWGWVKNQAVQKYNAVKSFRIADMEAAANDYMNSSKTRLEAILDPEHPLAEYFSSIRHYTFTLLGATFFEFIFQLFAIWFCGWNIFGRKAIVTGWLFTAGSTLIFMGLMKIPFALSHLPETYFGALFYGCAAFSRVLTVGAMVVLQLFMIELFPTSVKGGSYGFAVMMSMLATLASPYGYNIMEILFPGSFILAIGAISVFFSLTTMATIPDTLSRPTYDSLYALKCASMDDLLISSTMAPCKYCCYDFAHRICCCCFENAEYLNFYKGLMSKKRFKRTALLMVLEGKKEMKDVIRSTKKKLTKFATPRSNQTTDRRLD